MGTRSHEGKAMNLGFRGYEELTIGMVECEGLALVNLAKIEK
jgi:hypothetical protein